MRHIVRVEPSKEAADALDAGGGPGKLFAYIGERWRPEAFYVAAGKRVAFWVIDFADHASMVEFTHLALAKAGANPEYVPVLDGAEAAKIIPAAYAKAQSALR